MPVQWRAGGCLLFVFTPKGMDGAALPVGDAGMRKGPGGGHVGRAGRFICGTGAESGRGYVENTDVRR